MPRNPIKGRSFAGYKIMVFPLKAEEIPPGNPECSSCDGRFLVPEAGKPSQDIPIVLGCGHVYCLACVLSQVDVARNTSQKCAVCYNGASGTNMSSSGIRKASPRKDTMNLDKNKRGKDGHSMKASDGSSGNSRSNATASSHLLARVTRTESRAKDLLAILSQSTQYTRVKKSPTPAGMKTALQGFNTEYKCNVDMEDLDVALQLMKLHEGTAPTVEDVLNPFL